MHAVAGGLCLVLRCAQKRGSSACVDGNVLVFTIERLANPGESGQVDNGVDIPEAYS
jgi:hypothetical protein